VIKLIARTESFASQSEKSKLLSKQSNTKGDYRDGRYGYKEYQNRKQSTRKKTLGPMTEINEAVLK
jgi:hypothetical protein